jgi:hypothetical protein
MEREMSNDANLNALIAAMPPFGDYLIRSISKDIIVNRIISATPGLLPPTPTSRTGQDVLSPKECPKCSFLKGPRQPVCPNCGFESEGIPRPTMRSTFFPSYQAKSLENRVANAFNMSESDFADWACALIWEAICDVLNFMTKMDGINFPKIKTVLADRNSRTGGFARAAWYGTVLVETPGLVNSAFTALTLAHSAALKMYIEALGTNQWVSLKKAQGANWTHPEWEVFHHYVKMVALGASQDQIDALIVKWSRPDLDFKVPETVSAGKWIAYSPWGSATDKIDKDAIKEAIRPVILATADVYSQGNVVSRKNSHAYAFLSMIQRESAFSLANR